MIWNYFGARKFNFGTFFAIQIFLGFLLSKKEKENIEETFFLF